VTFVQKSSLIKRFQGLTFAFCFLLLLVAAGTYLASQTFLVNLRDLNDVNAVTDLAIRGTENISSARLTLEKLNIAPVHGHNQLVPVPDSKQLAPVYLASYQQADTAIDQAVRLSAKFPNSTHLLKDAKNSLEEMNKVSEHIFSLRRDNSPPTHELLTRDLLLVKQFELDSTESLRAVQIAMRKTGNQIFSSVYQSRFLPFSVSLMLAVFFSGFALVLGLSSTRRVERSLLNLLEATEKVAGGDLNYQVKILSSDEIGRLSMAFDQMVRSLNLSMKDVQKAVAIRDEFLSIASHELKTPITSLKMQMQFARLMVNPNKSPLDLQKLGSVLDMSNVQIDRLTKLVDDFLDVTRIESGKLTFDFVQTDLSKMTQEVLNRFHDALEAAHCSVKTHFPPTLLVKCDPFRIEQVFVNLLSNAMKYSPGKLIEVSLGHDAQFAVLSVKDHGAGIPLEKQKLIFDRFERVFPDQNVTGLGLGLYISKQIVDGHHGELSILSSPGQGATFQVKLPA
jgi:signal transduction histidine kinase